VIAGESYGVCAALPPEGGLPRTIALLDGGLTLFGVGGLLVSLRAFREARRSRTGRASLRERVVIVGAGDAGEILLRELQWKFSATDEGVGFGDEAPEKPRGRRARPPAHCAAP